MTMRMLIDARHREETRVAVVKGNRIEEFDFESAEHKQLKGNIYLAKVTRVEPSLQAAFIEYGGNRHGFLAFSEIHPDYYQIPKEDRDALLREEAEHAAEEERLRADDDDGDHDGMPDDGFAAAADDIEFNGADDGEPDQDGDAAVSEDGDEAGPPRAGNGGDDKAADVLRQKRLNLRRRYKIQDVVHRRQVLLVQVVKEERGNKGAALTTYLSLAGRYCVLMPNTSHGGGISRKISNAGDRKRLKSIMADMNLPRTMGCIVRTAGLSRTKTEIRRDFDYLARLWDEVREATLKAAAPALIYQDSDLVKRAIRDLYNKDIDEVIVEGEDGFRQAKEFMRLLMPSHARRVKPYADAVSLFQRNHVEDQLAAMYSPVVQLKSGGYLVINPTEALVSIDINSGRSTREHGIEATAVGTNLEAAHEIARQLRLRDMAGLVVIDFIDMENSGNIRKVEKAMKSALADDRARIQIGRISSFGLMEMSRQRLRTGVLEASTRQCPHCEGTGLVRTAASAGLLALRLLEEEAGQGRGSVLTLRASQEAVSYVLNRKRAEIAEIEDRYGVRIEVLSDGEVEGARMAVTAAGPPPAYQPRFDAPPVYDDPEDDIVDEVDEHEEEEARVDAERPARERSEASGDDDDGTGRKRRRRRGRRPRRDDEGAEAGTGEAGSDDAAERSDGEELASDDAPGEQEPRADRNDEGEDGEPRSRRGRRGGRRRRGRGGERGAEAGTATDDAAQPADDAVADAMSPEPMAAPAATDEPAAATDEAAAKPRRTRKRPGATVVDAAAETTADSGDDAPAKKPRRSRKKVDEAAGDTVDAPTPAEPIAAADGEAADAPAKPKRASRARKPKVAADTDAAAEAVPEPMADAAVPSAAMAGDADMPSQDAGEAAAPDATDADPAEAPPARRGWWQSTFGKRDD